MSDSNNVQREVEAEARRFFPSAVRRVEWLGYGDSRLIEPGEILPQFVLAEPRPGLVRRPGPRETLKAFQKANAVPPRTRAALAGVAAHWGHV
jgi:hypothetical protein